MPGSSVESADRGGLPTRDKWALVRPESQGLWSKSRVARVSAAPKGGPFRVGTERPQAGSATRTPLAACWTPSSELGLPEPVAPRGWEAGLWTGLPGGAAVPFPPLALCTELPTPRA